MRVETALKQVIERALSGTEYRRLRVHFTIAPQNAKAPYIVIDITAADSMDTLGGPTTLRNTKGEIYIIETSYEDSINIREIIHSGLHAEKMLFRLGSVEYGTSEFDPELQLHISQLSYSVWHDTSTVD